MNHLSNKQKIKKIQKKIINKLSKMTVQEKENLLIKLNIDLKQIVKKIKTINILFILLLSDFYCYRTII